MKKKKSGNGTLDIALKNYEEGLNKIFKHPMFSPLASHAQFFRQENNLCPDQGWAIVTANGQIHIHPTKRGTAEEWMYVLAHALLHLGFEHFQIKEPFAVWNTACDCFIAKFLSDLKLGTPPIEMEMKVEFSAKTELELFDYFLEQGIPEHLKYFGTSSLGISDMLLKSPIRNHWDRKVNWQACLGQGLAMSVSSAVRVSAGYESHLGANKLILTPAQNAKNWFISSFPLFGALAADFTIIEDPILCNRLQISVAAVNAEEKEIYINPAAGLDVQECRFVMAHEFLHVGLRHHARREGRDPYLWNVACDYVINGWLMDMGMGSFPRVGGLHDVELKGLSAESIYDTIVTDLRTYRKLATFRGVGLSDMIEPKQPEWWNIKDGLALDEFYRSCLSQGLSYHMDQERGYLPAGLVEEIRALLRPPIPWDVELAKWFDDHFRPEEKTRTYARISRRQSSTPDIPRPRWVNVDDYDMGRTFAVILDTSGSMDKNLLAKALGAIASYSIARDVTYVRVIFCDAFPYDQGNMPPEDIAGNVQIKGRGGTILQPAIDLIEAASDFPKTGPILIITDGYCDRLSIHREHAYILPKGRSLPFVAKGEVFRIE